LLVWALRLLVILLVIRLVLRMIHRMTTAQAPRRPAARKPERIGGALVRDPNCGTYITRERAITSGSGDGMLFFCSTECRDAYRVKASA
jgi:hypothetical protein